MEKYLGVVELYEMEMELRSLETLISELYPIYRFGKDKKGQERLFLYPETAARGYERARIIPNIMGWWTR